MKSKQPERLLIRTDASRQTGLGHVMRCLALAQQWQTIAGPVEFACATLTEFAEEQIVNNGCSVHSISADAGTRDDVRQTRQRINQTKPDAIVLDGYQFGPTFQQAIQSSQAPLLVIDDYAHLEQYHADLILNQNPGINAESYAAGASQAEILLGPKYALLRNEFAGSTLRKKDSNRQSQNLLVTLGGSDADEITRKVVEAVEMLSDPYLSTTLISPLSELPSTTSKIDLVPFVQDMAELYRQTDYAICAGGSTNWELARFGIPRLVIVLADNQRHIAEALDQSGCCHSLGWHSDVTARAIAEALNKLLTEDVNSMRAANEELVDGRGAERVVRWLAEICDCTLTQ